MRLVLRFSMLLAVAGLAWSQTLTDAAGVLAGSSVGAGAAKPVGQGVTAVLKSVSNTTTKAAKTEKVASVEKPPATPAKPAQRSGDGGGSGGSGSGGSGGGTVLKTGPGGVVKDHSLVPPPPVKKVAVVPPPPPLVPAMPIVIAPVLLLPPPPQATPEDLKTLAKGNSREEVLRLGPPSSRVTMIGDDGHLVEVFRYQTRATTFGVVRLSDGSVSSVEVR